MRFSLNFIQEFLKVDIGPRELAQRLTMAGMEVERCEQAGGDWVFDIEVTTNRYDWLSMAGIARETAAVLGKKLDIKGPSLRKFPALKEKNIKIEDLRDCPYYVGTLIKDVRPKASEAWLKQRILNCAIPNSINNIVDITNYCMLKWGNPLHAFDSDKIEGDIYIRRAKKGELFTGIDAKERILDKNNLVIADSKKVVALAGIMGAKNTEVDENTKSVFLEAAIFSPITVRRSRRAIGLDTESSYRFERQVSPACLERAWREAAELIEEQAKGSLAATKTAGKKPVISIRKISLSLKELNDYLGSCFSEAAVKKVLSSLDFKVSKAGAGKITVTPPVFRFDIKRDVDVYEEFARIQGYDKIPANIPFLTGCSQKQAAAAADIYHLKNDLAAYIACLGFKEIVTYSLTDSSELAKVDAKEIIKISNPLRKQEDALRNTLVLGMASSIKHNLNRGQSSLRFFEMADLYSKDKKGFLETTAIALGSSGSPENFFYLKRAIEEILGYFNISSFEFKQESLKAFASALKVVAGAKEIGFLGKLNAQTAKDCGLKEDLFFAQLDLAALLKACSARKYAPFSPYPAVSRDVSLVLKDSVKFREAENVIREKNSYLADLRVVDVYRGKDIPAGSSAFTLRIFYQSGDRTLTSAEVDAIHGNIRSKLSRREGISLR